ncbi:hypothetical protein [Shewanella youngdeokensis]|uniref:Uncharacterized protein n=1 Tax=Shewanella youngdeokensis TaxID=2999068 RepID=A0ABZ0JW05_9GAMM|nr:hypothetical protein RGE70_11955 [Shewanella sp. DAU334]
MLADTYGAAGNQVGVERHAGVGQNGNAASASLNQSLSQDDKGLVLSGRAARAQKIEALANDFFKESDFNTAQFPKLIQRFYQDEILSDEQLNRLSSSGFDVPSAQAQPLTHFIEQQRLTLSNSEQDRDLAATFDEASWVMSNMDLIQSPVVAQKANRVASEMTKVLDSDKELTELQQNQYQGIKSLMQLSSMTGEHQHATGQLNSYLALAKQH